MTIFDTFLQKSQFLHPPLNTSFTSQWMMILGGNFSITWVMLVDELT